MKNFLSFVVLVFVFSISLASHTYGEPDDVLPIPVPGSQDPWAPQIYSGQLHFSELSREMSFEAYDGLEFWLIEENGYIRPLEESESVDRQRLINAKDKNVRIQGEFFSPPASNSRLDNCPINDDGECLPRTSRLKVTQLEILN